VQPIHSRADRRRCTAAAPLADLNPIERAFAKRNALLRYASERTLEATWQTIGAFLRHFIPQECADYPANAGYGSI
jgi:transposase